MRDGNDALIQTASGLWIPKQTRFQRVQQAQQEVQQDPMLVPGRIAHWKAHEQPWRREPEIDQKRQQFLQQRLKTESDEKQDMYPFKEIALTRADLEWLVQRHKEKSVGEGEQQRGLNLRIAIFGAIDCTILPLEGAIFIGAQLKGASFSGAQLEDTNFNSAQLEGASFIGAQLKGASFSDAQLEDAHFNYAQLEDANFSDAQLKGANFSGAKLEDAHFNYAQLKGANFSGAHLEGANFSDAKLEDAHFNYAHLEGANFSGAHLEGTDFQYAKITNASFANATIVTAIGIGPIVADVTGWDEISLPIREWSEVKLLGDEARAKKRSDSQGKFKEATTRFKDYFAATRAYRQVATAVEGMGRKEESEKFAFRAQVMQRKMLWWSIWQRKRNFLHRLSDLRAWLFSWLLALLSGYGYRFGRSLSWWYIGILLTFAWLYVHLSQSVPPHSTVPNHLTLLDACILSVSDMVGRGFFRQDVTLSDPYAGWSVLEGLIGVFMDVVLISTLTQRLFKK